jgi:hypothetical protein
MIETDPGEITAMVVTLCGVALTAYTLTRALRVWNIALKSEPELRPMAMRRFTTQGLFLLMQLIMVLESVPALFMDLGPLQALLRNNTLSVISLILMFRTLIDHWQHRANDPRMADRRPPDAPVGGRSER